MGPVVVRVLGHAATHAIVHRYARKSGRSRASYGWSLFKDPTVAFGSKFFALTIGLAVTGFLMACQVPFQVVIALIIPFFFDEAAMLLMNGLEVVLLPLLIGCMVLPALVPKPSYITQTVPPVLGEVIDMPPPMLYR